MLKVLHNKFFFLILILKLQNSTYRIEQNIEPCFVATMRRNEHYYWNKRSTWGTLKHEHVIFIWVCSIKTLFMFYQKLSVNLDHVSKVSVSDTIDKGALRSAEAFLPRVEYFVCG